MPSSGQGGICSNSPHGCVKAEVEEMYVKRDSLIRLGGLGAMVGYVAYAMANVALWFYGDRIIRQLDMNKTIQTATSDSNVYALLRHGWTRCRIQ